MTRPDTNCGPAAGRASAGAVPNAPPAVGHYLAAVVAACGESGQLVSVVVFGSSATGGYQESVSDVDLLLVLPDGASAGDRERVREIVAALELRHGVGKQASPRGGRFAGALTRFADRITANRRTFFICTRADLLSGEPRRILGLPGAQALFVDRGAVPGIVASAITIWGEPLLESVRLPPIRRADVATSFFGLFNTVLLSAAVYAVLPEATKYAMDALKRSIHNCYISHHGRPASLAIEAAYFERRYGSNAAVAQLLALRREYRPSLRFIGRCLPALVKLHLRTALDLPFPREVHVQAGTRSA